MNLTRNEASSLSGILSELLELRVEDEPVVEDVCIEDDGNGRIRISFEWEQTIGE